MIKVVLFFTLSLQIACVSGRSFWRYVVEDDVQKPLENREQGTPDKPRMLSPHNVKVVYNDGSRSTEVLIPVLSSGQQIVIDHQGRKAGRSLALVPLPPTKADETLEENYLSEGGQISKAAAPMSLTNTHRKIRELAKAGQYELALQYAEKLLARYPSHAKSWRAKGSLLLRMGETRAAIEAYNRAEEIEPNASVRKQISKLEKSLDNQVIR